MPDDPTTLVSTAWLAERLGTPGLTVLDASWYLPGDRRDPKAEYLAGHIPGALFADIDALSDPATTLPHMLPSEARFAAEASRLGVGAASQVVVYDGAGLFSAARVWWLFRVMGHVRAAVLDGGMPKWRAEGRAVDGGPVRAEPAVFAANLDRSAVVSAAELALDHPQIADARSPGRFRGDEPEPRPGVRRGHIPGARSLPFRSVLNPDGTLRDRAGIEAAFAGAGIDPAGPVVSTCGSGVTAAILNLALTRAGRGMNRLYDGSWAEWGSRTDLPLELG